MQTHLFWGFWLYFWCCRAYISQVCYMRFSKLLNEFVKIDIWISLSCYMDLSKLIHGFLWVVTWICHSCYMDLFKLVHGFVKDVLWIYSLLPNKTLLKFDQDFEACWSFSFELKVLNALDTLCLWQCFLYHLLSHYRKYYIAIPAGIFDGLRIV